MSRARRTALDLRPVDPTRMEIERETGVAFFRGALNALAFSALLAALIGLYLIAG